MRNDKAPADTDEAGAVSASEELLFGGQLQYDMGWNAHHGAWLGLSLWSMARDLPRLVATSVRLAALADRRALRTVAAAEISSGITQAISLVAVNAVLARLLASGTVPARITHALPALLTVAVAGMVRALCTAASTAATGALEPRVQRVATERYLTLVAAVELKAIEDDEFHRLLDSASWGAESARRMVKYTTNVVNSLISLIAAAGVLTVLHPVLLPLLLLMTVPSAWGAMAKARRRYISFHRFVQHARAAQLLTRLMIEQSAAAELRLHGVGPWLLRHFRGMADTTEREQDRLARQDARTGLLAATATGAATAATFGVLGLLLWTGAMALSVGGTAVLAIRSGSASLRRSVLEISDMHQESLFVGDYERLCTEAERRATPTDGVDLPDHAEIRFEKVSFTYPGKNDPALADIDLVLPAGKTIALVGSNGSGKTTLVKLLCGLYAPDSGRIWWGEVDSVTASRAQIYDRVATLAQDFYRWPFTARVNIGIGRPVDPFDDDELLEAARFAGADDVITELPNGLGTLLSRGYKGGQQISGGQWQRLGFARTHFRQGRVLVADEPTSALDPKAEQRTFDQIRALADQGQTVVLVTHRLHSVRHADTIVVLDHGRIAEHGTFDQLMDPVTGTGAFRDAYLLQSSAYQHTLPAQANRLSADQPAGDSL
ncbi:ABC transporter ATP-binding protein [Streptomyces sp. CBMA152]|uniref:ABC transporter ATP-binding protein n=1 Tax=Streptomyces sp. CBMA152 TaxID=1896312 RepID=UPI001CB750EC|nr:ABC transporter ATP-binding protein [Streptomyces sp. CBMA152]MBD0742982.1 ABC transporter [Streptomyces sp. CBMA152]